MTFLCLCCKSVKSIFYYNYMIVNCIYRISYHICIHVGLCLCVCVFIHVPALAAFAILFTAGVTVINVKFRLE